MIDSKIEVVGQDELINLVLFDYDIGEVSVNISNKPCFFTGCISEKIIVSFGFDGKATQIRIKNVNAITQAELKRLIPLIDEITYRRILRWFNFT